MDPSNDTALLAARANIPELDPFPVPRDWRADKSRDDHECCATCHWDGNWNNIVTMHDHDSRSSLPRSGIDHDRLEQSASAGHFCCTVLLALSRKFQDLAGSHGSISFSGHEGLTVSHVRTNVESIYITSEGSATRAPPGAKVYAHGRHLLSLPWSEETLAWATDRIENCVRNHDCSAFQSMTASLPTRLLYIPDHFEVAGILFLNDTSALPQNTRYSALSHCWGKQKPNCLTTKETIDKYMTKGIPWKELPKTFKDAIQYTQKLDLKYIWIDSFCIIQKDPIDWEKEASKMFQYYSNAYITLGSTFATDCHGGFFSEQQALASRLYLFDMVFEDKKLAVYAFRFLPEQRQLSYQEHHNLFASNDSDYHLFKRGWTYQERLVSKRLLFFTEKQVFFECYAGRWLQESDLDLRTSIPYLTTLKGLYKNLLSTGDESEEASWTDLVRSFSVLKLSYATDKLPAFAAVAQQYLSRQVPPHTTDVDYLCGLRKSHLYCDLLWKAENSPLEKSEDSLLCSGNTYLAPSWSWASVPGPTVYEDSIFIGAGIGEGRATITLKDENLVFTKAGRFGRVLGGYIVIQGPVLDCTLECWDYGKKLDIYHGECLRLSNGWQVPNFKFKPDFAYGFKNLEGKRSSDKVAVCLLQIWVSDYRSGLLVLHRNKETNRYYRLGVCFFGIMVGEDVWLYLGEQFKDAKERVLEIE